MATGGSRFSPFNLYFEEVKGLPLVLGKHDKAMRIWNNLDPEEKQYYEEKSRWIKEKQKTEAYTPAVGGGDVAFENYERLERFIRSKGTGRMRGLPMKLIVVQYSAKYQVGAPQESRYLPNEVSVVTFSLAGGVEKEVHYFFAIPMEDVPPYCKAEMKDRRDEIHFIPYGADVGPSGLSPIEPKAKNLLEKMFGAPRDADDGESASLIFCLSVDQEIVRGSVKTLVDYVPDPGDRDEFLRRSNRTYDFEDLLSLLDRGLDRDAMVARIKDKHADDVFESAHCRCGYHSCRDETEVHCTLLRAHSALHLSFNSLVKPLNITLTRRHLHVEETGSERGGCSATFYARYPDEAPDEEQRLWATSRTCGAVEMYEDDSPRTKQLRFIESMFDINFPGEQRQRELPVLGELDLPQFSSLSFTEPLRPHFQSQPPRPPLFRPQRQKTGSGRGKPLADN